jgi:exodeoxyribonuclease VII large subunit
MAVYTVSQVTTYLRQSLESDALLQDLWVAAEVSNLRVSSSGHSYFTVKDEQSVLNCVMFRGQPGAEILAHGAAVSVHGKISFYAPRGSTDFMVDLAMPEGMGERYLELERLRLRLEAEGLFEASRKRRLPEFPQVVGVVTSPAGSVFHDIENVIRRRYPLVEILLSPTPVQGASAASAIAAALELLDRDGRADVIIIARGGGSLEELWPFNEESVARAIYACKTPVISAIGHETDYTIADYVADLRAPTPSAAAEVAVPEQGQLRRRLAELAGVYERAATFQLENKRASAANLLRRMDQELPNLDTLRRRVDDLARSLQSGATNRIMLARSRIEGLELQLSALDPTATLARGFSVVENLTSNQIVVNTSQVSPGDRLTITVADGAVPATAGTMATAPNGRKKRRTAAKAQPPSMERLF